MSKWGIQQEGGLMIELEVSDFLTLVTNPSSKDHLKCLIRCKFKIAVQADLTFRDTFWLIQSQIPQSVHTFH